MKYLEIEYKYNAASISLSDFTKFCEGRGPSKFILASGYDFFYDNLNDKDYFGRYRLGADTNQLTTKRKTVVGNNFVRGEINVDLAPGESKAKADALFSFFGYKFNTSIFKNCFVYKFDYYTLVYYLVYDVDMNEVGRFVEIEMDEDHAWKSEAHASAELQLLEKLCKPLGITPQGRIKRSLFEMFRKEDT